VSGAASKRSSFAGMKVEWGETRLGKFSVNPKKKKRCLRRKGGVPESTKDGDLKGTLRLMGGVD